MKAEAGEPGEETCQKSGTGSEERKTKEVNRGREMGKMNEVEGETETMQRKTKRK